MHTIRVACWNIAGAKFLELADDKREEFRTKLNKSVCKLCEDFHPDFVALQEIVRFGDPAKPQDLIKKIPGYSYDPTISIDTSNQRHPQKWKKYRTRGGWGADAYLAQGYGLLWREPSETDPRPPPRPAAIWDFVPADSSRMIKEVVHLDTGLFTGTRDTEPRLAVVSHFIFDLGGVDQDVFVVNLHLTTLKGEREGSPSIDTDASEVRREQIRIITRGIVSRYNEWANTETEKQGIQRRPPVWILAGDFNCMQDSPEINLLTGMNFIDLNPNKGTGTKGSRLAVERPTITLDYIFAGPAYYSLDPYFVKKEIRSNQGPLTQFVVSDHVPIFAEVPIVLEVGSIT